MKWLLDALRWWFGRDKETEPPKPRGLPTLESRVLFTLRTPAAPMSAEDVARFTHAPIDEVHQALDVLVMAGRATYAWLGPVNSAYKAYWRSVPAKSSPSAIGCLLLMFMAMAAPALAQTQGENLMAQAQKAVQLRMATIALQSAMTAVAPSQSVPTPVVPPPAVVPVPPPPIVIPAPQVTVHVPPSVVAGVASITLDQWIAVAAITLPLLAKVAVDLAAYLTQRKHTALANLVGMAGREAATIGRTLAALPAGSNAKDVELALINASTREIMTRMGDSASTVGADSLKVAGIVQGELNKVLVPAVVETPTPAAATPPPPTSEPLASWVVSPAAPAAADALRNAMANAVTPPAAPMRPPSSTIFQGA